MNTPRFPRLRAVVVWGMVISVLLVCAYVGGYLWRTGPGRISMDFQPPIIVRLASSWEEVRFWNTAATIEEHVRGTSVGWGPAVELGSPPPWFLEWEAAK